MSSSSNRQHHQVQQDGRPWYQRKRGLVGILAFGLVGLNLVKDYQWRTGQAQTILEDVRDRDLAAADKDATVKDGERGARPLLLEREMLLVTSSTNTPEAHNASQLKLEADKALAEARKAQAELHRMKQELEAAKKKMAASKQQAKRDQETPVPSRKPTATPTTVQIAKKDDKHDGCFQHNSEGWLQGPRIGNARDILAPGQTEQDLHRYIVNSPKLLESTHQWTTATQSTLCHKDSHLTNIKNDDNDHWQDRAIFAALQYHQAKHAIPEAKARLDNSNTCSSQLKSHNIYPMDYECPNAQHIIINMGGPGLGANVRGGVNVALIAGLATNRVAHVLVNVPHNKDPPMEFKRKFHSPRNYPFKPWDLASCDRQDYQCVFMPLTPCVLTQDDFDNAHVLNKTEHNAARDGKLPDYLNATKVIIYQNSFASLGATPKVAQQAIQEYISTTILPQAPNKIDFSPQKIPMARRSFDRLLRVATVYSLRLLPKPRQKVAEMVQTLGQPLETAIPSQTIGLPIRASDKCNSESECLTYQEHLQAATDFWQKQHPNTGTKNGVSMIVTTESAQIRQEHDNFTASTLPHPFRNYSFLSNTFDEPPDGGNANPFKTSAKEHRLDADQFMIGSLASMHLQMHATLFVANSCSNYHHLLFDMVHSGCSAPGGAEGEQFSFLQESENPWFRVCCWIKGPGAGCKREREKFRPKVTSANSVVLLPGQEPDKGDQDVCFQHNSEAWLKGPRLGNAQDILAQDQTEQDLQQLIVNSPNLLKLASGKLWTAATQSTICHRDSRLTHLSKKKGEDDIHWQDRAIYAAIHYHQVQHAISEAEARIQGGEPCSSKLRSQEIYPMDYECPNAQHFVINLGSPGLGANIRGGVNIALMAGLASGRVAHAMVNVPREGKMAEHYNPRKYPFKPWDLASCDRKDFQCVFMPLSPCVLTQEDFTNAHILNGTEFHAAREGKLPDYLNATKVLIYQNSFTGLQSSPKAAQQAIQTYVDKTIMAGDAAKINFAPPKRTMMKRKMDPLGRVATVYTLRLLPKARQQVSELVRTLGQPLEQAVPSQTIGLPIRASDKCNMESECLTYQEHLQAATDFWQKHHPGGTVNGKKDSVSMIVTTESSQIRQEHENFTASTSLSPFHQYSFLSNTFDEPPDGGNSDPFKKSAKNQLDADQFMIGSLASMHLQMYSSFFVANSCSNYHHVLFDLAVSGCSAPAGEGQSEQFYFLQESENPWFRVCCWIKAQGKQCSQNRLKFRPNTTALPEVSPN